MSIIFSFSFRDLYRRNKGKSLKGYSVRYIKILKSEQYPLIRNAKQVKSKAKQRDCYILRLKTRPSNRNVKAI